ncbi:hypothetical protein GT031_10350, partial [Streptomyces sp. SID2888]|nr:hypothetical protein [Streptomyces sp. SID2888]
MTKDDGGRSHRRRAASKRPWSRRTETETAAEAGKPSEPLGPDVTMQLKLPPAP